jgi:hypothetical protein
MIQIGIKKLERYPWIALKIFFVILAINIIAVIIGCVTGHHSMRGFLDLVKMDQENNLGVYFSSFNLLVAALLLFIIYRLHIKIKVNDSRYWLILSIIFLALSIDETVAFHELFATPLRELIDVGRIFYFAWVIPALIIVGLFAMYFLKFFLSLPSRYKILFGLSALMFAGGAICMEIIEGFLITSDKEEIVALYYTLTTIEESAEMLGVILFIYSLIDYLKLETKPGEIITIGQENKETA